MTDNSVTLSWKEPHDNGGKPIKRYIVERKDPLKNISIPVGSCDRCEYRVIRLTSGNDYVLAVSAENEVGRGKAAELRVNVKNPFCSFACLCLCLFVCVCLSVPLFVCLFGYLFVC